MKKKTESLSKIKKPFKATKTNSSSLKKSVPTGKQKSEKAVNKKIATKVSKARRTINILKEVSSENYKDIIEKFHEGIFVLDLAGNFTFLNNAVCHALGYTKKELIGTNSRRFTHTNDQGRVLKAYNKVFKTGRPLGEIGYYITRKNGENRYIEASIQLRKDSSGKPIGFRGIAYDFTERKQAEEKLKKEEQRFKILAEQSFDIIILLDDEGKIIYENPAVEKILGFKIKERVGRNVFDNINPEDVNRVKGAFAYFVSEKKSFPRHNEVCLRDINGNLHTFESISSHLFKNDVSEGIIVNLRDITERKKIEEISKKAAQEWQATFDAVSEAICLLDENQHIIRTNLSMREMFGLTEENLKGRHCWEIIHGTTEPIPDCPIVKARISHQREEMELKMNDKWLNVVVYPLLDDKQKITSVVHIIRDINERKQSEEELRQSQESYRRLFEDHSAVKLIIDPSDGMIIDANQAAAKYYGWTRGEMKQIKISDINTFTPEEVKISLDKSHINKKSRFEFRHRLADGSIRDVEVFSSPIQMNGKNVLHSIVFDITERKLADEKLHAEEQRFRALAEQSSDIILLLDEKGSIVYENPAIKSIMGYNPEDRIGRNVFDTIYPDDLNHVLEAFNTLLSDINAPIQHTEVRVFHPDGNWRTLEIAGSNLVNNDTVEGVIVNLRDVTKRKKAEDELKTAYKQLENIIEFLPDATMISDKNNKIIAWNRAMENMTGVLKEDMIGQDNHEITIPFYGERRMFLMDLVFTPDRELEEKYSNVKRFGNVIQAETFTPALYNNKGAYVFAAACPLFDSAGNVVGIIESIRDVTERKFAEHSLRESEEKFRILIESSPTAILLFQDNKWVYANPVATEITGYTNQELLGMNFWDMVHPDDRQLVQERGQKRQKGEPVLSRYVFRIICKDGTVKWVDLSGATIAVGGSPAGIISVLNITERKLAEEALRENEIKYRTLFEYANDSILIMDNDIFIDCNQKTLEIYDCTREQIIGQPPYKFSPEFQPDGRSSTEKALEKINAALNGHPQFFEWKHCHYDGTLFDAEVSLNAFLYKGKTHIQSIVRDITERKKTDNEILYLNKSLEQRVRERTAELEAFSYSVSHDLRAPLRAIHGFGQALMEDYCNQLDDSAKDYLSRIKRATETMNELIDDMLKLSRISRTEMDIELVNLSHVVKSIMDELQKAQPERLVHVIIAENLNDLVDPRLMRIVFENLLSNAWKFTQKNGKFEIEFGNIKKNGKIVYFIRDNGAGFDMDYAKKLFSPFQRLHSAEEYPGTGIGLAIVKRIISRHQGSVWAEASIGKGTTIFFTLND